ncbi:hypothetical protein DKT69_23415 [Micromonospora sicca]|uniref:Uncharacterized protein n=1 Tax=Micromonospora sicca TaxID=2202420 RepID=A0A317DEA1_9ACTN|nr:hypothetical protein [Micromonospora sp. 4G51]PWR12622.1 hypothetical protein DKT69_23415 [Micromonospora sp. 4G51]
MVYAQTAQSGWTAAQTAIVIVAVIAILGGIVSASVTYTLNQSAARRERQAKAFAEALNAVEDYAEMPYRVRRRRDTPEARYDLTDEVSKIQSRLAYHQALLQIEAPEVAASYATLVRATKIQAGGQMRQAWQQPVLTTDADMNLQVRYPRDQIDAARGACIATMRAALRRHRTRHAPTLPTANSDQPEIPPPTAGDDQR